MSNSEEMRQKIANIRSRIEKAALRSGRRPEEITLVAVSKTVDTDIVKMAYDLGIGDFGENRVQELTRKIGSLPAARWHMIGRLQTNKVKDIAERVCLIHSLDRWNLAVELEKRGRYLEREIPVLLQVNVSGEKSKTGIAPDDLLVFLQSLGELDWVKVYGLMTIAPLIGVAEESRPIFRELSQLKKQLNDKTYKNVDLKHLSMGMTQDFEIAIEEGANIVRIGSALFQNG